jgi:hypothetical protein
MRRMVYVTIYLLTLVTVAGCTNRDVTYAVEYPESRFDPEAQ